MLIIILIIVINGLIYMFCLFPEVFDIVKLSYFISDSLSTKAIYYNL